VHQQTPSTLTPDCLMFIIRWIFRSIVLTMLTRYAAKGLPVLLGFLRTLRR
jgi:hypothetical protein